MYSLNTNIDALNARNAARVNSNALSESLRRLSTGIRINSSVDDSAGLIEANRLRGDSQTLKESIKNANNTIAMFQIIDKALDQQISLLDTIRAKSIQSATDGQSKITREALQKEIEDLLKELDNIAKETSFGNQKLLDGTFFNKKVHIGKDSSNVLDFSFAATSSDKMGFSSYMTTQGGERLIPDLKLTFKNTGTSNEDVTLAPFTLSTSPGKRITDLADFVNKYSKDTGVRAIYKEGNTLPIYKQRSFRKDIINENKKIQPQTASSYIKKDFPSTNKVKVSNISFFPSTKSSESISKDINNEVSLKTDIKDLDYNINFRASPKPIILTPLGKTFYETLGTKGSGTNLFNKSTVTLQLNGDKLTKGISSDDLANAISVENLPEYLKMEFTPIGNTIELNIIKDPTKTVPTDTIDTLKRLRLKFHNPEIFESKISPNNLSGLTLAYQKNPKIHFTTIGKLKEEVEDNATTGRAGNSGDYSGKITIQLQGGEFTDTANPQAVVRFFPIDGNYPIGLGNARPSINIGGISIGGDKRTLIIDERDGKATNHGAGDDILITPKFSKPTGIDDKDLHFIFKNLDTGDPLSSIFSTMNSTIVDFVDQPSLAIKNSWTEHSDNDGTISTSIILQLTGDTFKDLSPEDIKKIMEVDNDVFGWKNPKNKIAGLVTYYKKSNSNEIRVTFTQKKSGTHTRDIGYPAIELPGALLTNNLKSTATPAGNISFYDELTITKVNADTTSFKEIATSPGSVAGELALEITDGIASFSTIDLKNNIDVRLPDGLTPSFRVSTNHQQIIVSIKGSTQDHNLREEDIKIGFKREAFNPNLYSTSFDSHINFYDSAYIIADGPFIEDGATNDGTFTNSVILTLKNNEKLNIGIGANKILIGDNLIPGAEFEINGLPSGFTTPTLTVRSDDTVTMRLNGKANPHIENTNMKLILKGNILKSGIDTKSSDIKIEFKKSSKIIQIGEIKESAANNGKIASKVTFELTNGEFINNPIININTIPVGLIPTWDITTNPTQAILEFVGTARPHASFNSRTLEINFKNAIRGGATDTKDLDTYMADITFIDELPEFTKLGGNFIEDKNNNGQISGIVTLELPAGIDFAVDDYDIDHPDVVNKKTGLSLNKFLRQNIKASNLPYITETIYRIDPLNPRRLKVSFLENNENLALRHSPSDDTSFRLSFQSGLFADRKNISDISLDVKFYDTPEVIAFGSFKESSRNDGSTDNYVELSVLGSSFARVNPNNYIKVKGIPSSLSPKFITDGSSIKFYLEGRAKKHDEFDDLNNIELEFLVNSRGESPLFENGIRTPNLKGIRFDFRNKPILELNENFEESFSNNGSIKKPITINLKDGHFKTDIDPKKYITMSKVPPGLKTSYTIVDETTLVVALTGNAFNHSISESVTKAELSFDPEIFTSGIRPDKIKNIGISFLGSPEGTYSGGFVENEINDGSVSGTVTMIVEKDTFRSGLNLDDYIILGNLPAGLTPKYILKDENTIEFTLEGRALNHTDFNDVNDLSVNFTADLFTQRVLPDKNIKDISVDFKDSPKIFYNDYFRESSKNDGSIRNKITFNLFGDNFTAINPNADGVISVKNLPDGITPFFTRIKANQMTMELLGSSNKHTAIDSIQDIEVEFINKLFKNGVATPSVTNIFIDYRDRPKMFTKDKLIESSFNDGSFNDPVTFNLSGDTFNTKSDPNTTIFVKNLPAGLNPKFTILNDSQIELKLTGNAINHDISSIKPELIFKDPELFFNGIPPEDIIIKDFNFVKAPKLKLENAFKESYLNDGSILSSVKIILEDGEFGNLNNNELKKLISISNLPSGLEPVFTLIDNKNIQLTLRGNAVKHTNLYDVNNLRLEFSQKIFKTGVSGNIITNGIIDFREPPKVNTKSFIESEANDGTVKTIVTLTLADNEKFTNLEPSEYIRVIGAPDGLKPIFRRGDSTYITMRFNGAAQNHANINDVDDMTLEFDSTLFESGQKADPITNMVVDFKDPPPPTVEASKNIFEEADKNEGAIKESIDFSIKYDTISDAYKFKYSATVKDIKDIIGNGNNLILNGINIPDIDINDANFYPKLIKKINNNGNGTGGLYAKLVGTDLRLFKDFQNTIKLEGRGRNRVIDNDDENNKSIKRDFKTSEIIGHLVEATGIPKGLTPKYTYISNILFSVQLVGSAVNHLNRDDTNRDDIESLKFRFKSGLFSRQVQGKDLNDISINFNDPTIEFSDSFRESKSDNGNIENKITITLFGDKFNDETNLDKFIVANNIPKGLKPTFVRLSDNTIEMSLEGNATNHLNEHDINNITLSFSKDLFVQGLAIFPKNKLSIDFNDPPAPIYVSGGPGAYGGYITFVSNKSSDLIVESGDANFGVNNSEFSTTLNLRDAITKKLTSKDLYGMGYTDDIPYLIHEKSIIKGVTNKQSSLIVMDTVDSALEYLKKMRAKVASYQNQVEKRVEYLNVERVNLRSAESAIREIDFAEETSNFQKRNLLTQAGNYAISQANASKKMILALLQQ